MWTTWAVVPTVFAAVGALLAWAVVVAVIVMRVRDHRGSPGDHRRTR